MPDMTKTVTLEALPNYMAWSKGIQKHIKLPKEVRDFIKDISKQRTVYRFVRPRAVMVG